MKKFLKSKLMRTFTCLALVATMLIGTSTTAFAQISGTETWHGPSDESAYFTVHNNNLSPRKTVAFSGPLFVWIEFSKADSSSSPVKVTLEVRNITRGTSTSAVFGPGDASDRPNVGMTVNSGDVLQVFIDVSTADGYAKPGYYRSARIKYGYSQNWGSWL